MGYLVCSRNKSIHGNEKVRTSLITLILGLIVLTGNLRGEEAEITPEELNRTGYQLARQAQQAALGEDLKLAYDRYGEAIKIYQRIEKEFSDWQPRSVTTRLRLYRERAREIGEKAFEIPKGYVRIWPGMPREGTRYDKGRALAMKVKKMGENEYEVDGLTVTLIRAGPLLGAKCTGPDFLYRGRKHGFACKHVWAVVEKEGLLIGEDSGDSSK